MLNIPAQVSRRWSFIALAICSILASITTILWLSGQFDVPPKSTELPLLYPNATNVKVGETGAQPEPQHSTVIYKRVSLDAPEGRNKVWEFYADRLKAEGWWKWGGEDFSVDKPDLLQLNWCYRPLCRNDEQYTIVVSFGSVSEKVTHVDITLMFGPYQPSP